MTEISYLVRDVSTTQGDDKLEMVLKSPSGVEYNLPITTNADTIIFDTGSKDSTRMIKVKSSRYEFVQSDTNETRTITFTRDTRSSESRTYMIKGINVLPQTEVQTKNADGSWQMVGLMVNSSNKRETEANIKIKTIESPIARLYYEPSSLDFAFKQDEGNNTFNPITSLVIPASDSKCVIYLFNVMQVQKAYYCGESVMDSDAEEGTLIEADGVTYFKGEYKSENVSPKTLQLVDADGITHDLLNSTSNKYLVEQNDNYTKITLTLSDSGGNDTYSKVFALSSRDSLDRNIKLDILHKGMQDNAGIPLELFISNATISADYCYIEDTKNGNGKKITGSTENSSVKVVSNDLTLKLKYQVTYAYKYKKNITSTQIKVETLPPITATFDVVSPSESNVSLLDVMSITSTDSLLNTSNLKLETETGEVIYSYVASEIGNALYTPGIKCIPYISKSGVDTVAKITIVDDGSILKAWLDKSLEENTQYQILKGMTIVSPAETSFLATIVPDLSQAKNVRYTAVSEDSRGNGIELKVEPTDTFSPPDETYMVELLSKIGADGMTTDETFYGSYIDIFSLPNNKAPNSITVYPNLDGPLEEHMDYISASCNYNSNSVILEEAKTLPSGTLTITGSKSLKITPEDQKNNPIFNFGVKAVSSGGTATPATISIPADGSSSFKVLYNAEKIKSDNLLFYSRGTEDGKNPLMAPLYSNLTSSSVNDDIESLSFNVNGIPLSEEDDDIDSMMRLELTNNIYWQCPVYFKAPPLIAEVQDPGFLLINKTDAASDEGSSANEEESQNLRAGELINPINKSSLFAIDAILPNSNNKVSLYVGLTNYETPGELNKPLSGYFTDAINISYENVFKIATDTPGMVENHTYTSAALLDFSALTKKFSQCKDFCFSSNEIVNTFTMVDGYENGLNYKYSLFKQNDLSNDAWVSAKYGAFTVPPSITSSLYEKDFQWKHMRVSSDLLQGTVIPQVKVDTPPELLQRSMICRYNKDTKKAILDFCKNQPRNLESNVEYLADYIKIKNGDSLKDVKFTGSNAITKGCYTLNLNSYLASNDIYEFTGITTVTIQLKNLRIKYPIEHTEEQQRVSESFVRIIDGWDFVNGYGSTPDVSFNYRSDKDDDNKDIEYIDLTFTPKKIYEERSLTFYYNGIIFKLRYQEKYVQPPILPKIPVTINIKGMGYSDDGEALRFEVTTSVRLLDNIILLLPPGGAYFDLYNNRDAYSTHTAHVSTSYWVDTCKLNVETLKNAFKIQNQSTWEEKYEFTFAMTGTWPTEAPSKPVEPEKREIDFRIFSTSNPPYVEVFNRDNVSHIVNSLLKYAPANSNTPIEILSFAPDSAIEAGESRDYYSNSTPTRDYVIIGYAHFVDNEAYSYGQDYSGLITE